MLNHAEKEIWVYGDLRNERLFDFSLKVLAKARELARSISGKVAVVLMGSSIENKSETLSISGGFISADDAAKNFISHGADYVYFFDNSFLAVPRPDLYAAVLADAVQDQAPLLVLFPLTDFGRETAARTARMNNAGSIADCMDLKIVNNKVVAACPSWGGKVMAEISFVDHQKTGFATVQPHAFEPIKVSGEPGIVKKIKISNLKVPQELKFISSSQESAEYRKLEDADIVIVGGAGLGSAEGFGLVRNLAVTLGGQVGATRPPVLQHWVDEERLIGQTGKTVRPKLLFSIGTSGATQYTAGIMEAQTIVVINRDPNAPIFQVADLGIVADAKTFLPQLIAKAKRVVMRKMADVLGENKTAKGKDEFGIQIRKLRESHNWSIENLAKATGQPPEFIEQVESNRIVPPVSFLLGLARALDVDPGTFLRDEEKTMIQDQRTKAFIKRTQNYSYQTLTPGAENQKLRAFMVTIESKQDHKPVAYKHEGEEFVFVMEGDLELTLGRKKHQLKAGESIHFNSEVPHKLKSLSDEPTRCLVVLDTP
ncbi:MAG: FAD-binding protein [Desulfobacterales bacterium]|nr:FAD-binding protein [Desulfobacterales bacterium]